MEFKIKHNTKWIHYGIGMPWLVLVIIFLIPFLLGFDFNNEFKAMFLLVLLALCAPFELFFIILFVIEQLYGARIFVESDYIDVRMVLRHKRIRFNEITEVKYSHYYDSKETDLCGTPDISYSFGPQLRSKLTFYLTSGKVFVLNDKALGYEQRQKRSLVDHGIEPDENIRLYQAYQCYCSAVNQYKLESAL